MPRGRPSSPPLRPLRSPPLPALMPLFPSASRACPQELDHPEFGHYAVKRALATALDKHGREREMTSVLLSTLYNEVRAAPRCAGPAPCLLRGCCACGGA